MYGKDITYKMELLSRENYELVCSFSCGNEVIDDFLRKEALDSEDLRTYLFPKMRS